MTAVAVARRRQNARTAPSVTAAATAQPKADAPAALTAGPQISHGESSRTSPATMNATSEASATNAAATVHPAVFGPRVLLPILTAIRSRDPDHNKAAFTDDRPPIAASEPTGQPAHLGALADDDVVLSRPGPPRQPRPVEAVRGDGGHVGPTTRAGGFLRSYLLGVEGPTAGEVSETDRFRIMRSTFSEALWLYLPEDPDCGRSRRWCAWRGRCIRRTLIR